MSLHKLKPGVDLIEGIAALGTALGYHVKKEFLIRKESHAPAVDVAWLRDENQNFPLMIFEVETAAGNTIANNAVKVLGQPTNEFEKPLFFFHLVLKAGRKNSRIEALTSAHGTDNYRIYSLDQGDKEKLLFDILSQHRRLTNKLSFLTLIQVFDQAAWKELNNPKFFRRVEALRYTVNYLREYALLSKAKPAFYSNYIMRLARESETDSELRDYGTFIGDTWHVPIHLALLRAKFPDRRNKTIDRLIEWQTNKPHQSLIGPHFGLSRDYDEFILSLGAGLLAAIAALFNSARASHFVAEELQTILKVVSRNPDRIKLHYQVWLLHVSASLSNGSIFRETKAQLNQSGGIPSHCLLSPPLQIPVYDECEWDETILQKRFAVPEAGEFQRIRAEAVKRSLPGRESRSVGLELLIRTDDINDLSADVVRLLSLANDDVAMAKSDV